MRRQPDAGREGARHRAQHAHRPTRRIRRPAPAQVGTRVAGSSRMRPTVRRIVVPMLQLEMLLTIAVGACVRPLPDDGSLDTGGGGAVGATSAGAAGTGDTAGTGGAAGADAAGTGGAAGAEAAGTGGAAGTGASEACASPIGPYDRCEGTCGCYPVTQAPVVEASSVTNECGNKIAASINGRVVTAPAWNESATLSADGKTLQWEDGSRWVRSCAP